VNRFLDRIRPKRKIDANSAVLLPFTRDGKPDYEEFERHLLRTARAGITPAVNMDTGFGPQLTPAERVEVLRRTRRALGTAPFIAGAGPFGETYEQAVASILDQGAVPIVFQSDQFSSGDVVALTRKIVAPAPKALAFELGKMFAPFGRIYDLETYERLLDIPNLVGAKHSSLSRGGAPLLGWLEREAETLLGPRAMWWASVARTRTDVGGFQVVAAQLDPDARFSFRIDLPLAVDPEPVLASLSALCDDAAFPGYPYPLAVADRLAACSGWLRADLRSQLDDLFDRAGVPFEVRERAFADRHNLMERA